jgi:hypothetical protein
VDAGQRVLAQASSRLVRAWSGVLGSHVRLEWSGFLKKKIGWRRNSGVARPVGDECEPVVCFWVLFVADVDNETKEREGKERKPKTSCFTTPFSFGFFFFFVFKINLHKLEIYNKRKGSYSTPLPAFN